VDKARLLAGLSPHAGDWLHAPPITAVGLRLSDEAVRVAVAHRLGCKACVPYTCVCGKPVDARGLHGLSCRRSAPRQQRHGQLNDIIWRALKQAQIPSAKETVSLVRDDKKRPDGTTLLPWVRGKPMAWDVNSTRHIRRVPYQQHSGQSRCSSSQSSTEQDGQIRPFGQQPHLLSVCHRDSRCMA